MQQYIILNARTHTHRMLLAQKIPKSLTKMLRTRILDSPSNAATLGAPGQKLCILSSGWRITPTYKNAPQPLTVDSQNLKSFMNALPQVVEILARAVHLLLPWILSREDLFVHSFLDFATESKSSFSHACMVLNCSLMCFFL